LDPFPWFQRRVAHLLGLERYPRRIVWLRRLLAGWILFHMAAVGLMAVPAPRPLSPDLLRRASVRQEISRWHERLHPLGLFGERSDFEAAVVRVSKVWSHTRRGVLAPLRSYLDLVRVRQGWYMFTAPDTAPERFRLDAGRSRAKRGRAQKLERVFELGLPSNRPDLVPDAFLYHHRVRRALFMATWRKNDAQFQGLCDAFQARLTRLEPKLRSVRCRLLARKVEHPTRIGEKRDSRTVRTSLRRVPR
jgi:hypothetical protein